MNELEILKDAVIKYFEACEPAQYQTLEMKSEAARLRDVADKLDACENAKRKLKELVNAK